MSLPIPDACADAGIIGIIDSIYVTAVKGAKAP